MSNPLGHPKILVVGDAMLDRYTWGNAERVSPEAPVLILRTDEREVRLGGAASVALLLRALEVDATLAAVIGDDHDGRTLCRLLEEAGIDQTPLFLDASRPTTTKERFLGRSEQRQAHQMLRVDSESQDPIDHDLTAQLANALARLVPQQDVVLISDYGKGVCTPSLIAELISLCQNENIPVLVDPARGVDYERYRGATLIKPNRYEAELAIGHTLRTPQEAMQAAATLRERYEVEQVIITLDQDGLVFATAEGTEHQSITPRPICDITGAGDTVLATLGAASVARTPSFVRQEEFATIAKLANIAAGLQVARPGVTPISRTELLEEFDRQTNIAATKSTTVQEDIRTSTKNQSHADQVTTRPPYTTSPRAEASRQGNARQSSTKKSISTAYKLVPLESAQVLAESHRRQGRTIVFTNGCFDLLHIGHITTLEAASQFGDVLFVAINSDQSVRQLKGNDRPIISEQDRAQTLAALSCVDHVLIFDDATPHRLLEAIRPDVLAKGGTTVEIVGCEFVESYGGQVVQTRSIPGRSTTQLVKHLQCPIPIEVPTP